MPAAAPAQPRTGSRPTPAASPQAQPQPARPFPAPARPKLVATSGLRQATAAGIRKMAAKTDEDHPNMGTSQHLRDAANALDRTPGGAKGAERHLTAAIHTLAPLSLHRHGIMDDANHTRARRSMDAVNRHLLLVQDIKDAEEANENRLAQHEAVRNMLTVAQPAGSQPPAWQQPTSAQPGQTVKKADLSTLLDLSAETAGLAVTPHPFGKPGGPGLWHVKGMELPPYIQNIAHALLRTGRAKNLSQAIAMAKAATDRWKRGGGKVSPEVQAASAATSAQWAAKQARAHSMSNDWGTVLDLALAGAGFIELYNPDQARAAAGSAAGGQFAAGTQQGAAAGKMTHAQRVAKAAQLRAQAHSLRLQAHALAQQIHAIRQALRAATSQAKRAKAKPGKASTTPAKKGAPAKKSPKAGKGTTKGAVKTAAQKLAGMIQRHRNLLNRATVLDAQAKALLAGK